MLEDMSGYGGAFSPFRTRHRTEPGNRIVLQSGLPLDLARGFARSDDRAPIRHRLRLFASRAFDLALAVPALILVLPILIVIGLVIRLAGPGPVLFRQYREGLGGVPFVIYKFRTLRTRTAPEPGFRQVGPGDARVTAIGRFLRRYSIDELPQIVNVIRGDMAWVGPRPHLACMRVCGKPYRALVPYYDRRLAIKPGLSGWAQVNGLRGPVDTPDAARARIDHDLAYIQNASIALDLRIIAMTLFRLHRGEGT